MNPLALKVRNLRTFATLDLDLPAGCTAITGVNGAGKSTLINAIDWALFGPDGRSWAPYLTQGVESTELEVELVFEHANELYRVRRSFSARGTGKTAFDFERNMLRDEVDEQGGRQDSWVPETLETQTATQAHLEQVLGLTRETFRASAFLAQGDGSAWTEAPAARRKEILAAILGLNRFQGYADVVKADRKTAENLTARLTGGLERADAELAERGGVVLLLDQARDNVSTLTANHAEAVAAHETATGEVARLDDQRAARRVLEAEAATATSLLAALEQRVEAARQAGTDLEAAEKEIATLTTPEQAEQAAADLAAARAAVETYRDLVAEVEQARRDRAAKVSQRDAIAAQGKAKRAEVDALDEQLARIQSDEVKSCPTCQQHLGAEARRETMSNLRARATILEDEISVLADGVIGISIGILDLPADPEPPIAAEAALADASRRVSQAQTDSLRRERLQGQVQLLRQSVAAAPAGNEVAAAVAQRDAATSLLAQTPAVNETGFLHARERTQRLLTDAFTIGRNLDAAKADAARVEERLRRLDELAASTAADRVERERQQTLIDRLVILERAFGRDGIPAMIVQGAALPAIETEAGRILGELGTSYRVELRTAKALAGGGMADALDVVVVTDTGERMFETFSGGEKTRLNLALRIALARLLASRRGAEVGVLTIDEPEGLDEAGMAGLVRVLQGLNGTFSKTFLVSHAPDLRSAFDASLEVIKGDDGLSRVIA